MQKLEFTKRFLKQVEHWKLSWRGLEPLHEFIDIVKVAWPPPPKYEAHMLRGSLDGIWDIHLRQNWILLVRFQGGTVRFLRMGTHAELGL